MLQPGLKVCVIRLGTGIVIHLHYQMEVHTILDLVVKALTIHSELQSRIKWHQVFVLKSMPIIWCLFEFIQWHVELSVSGGLWISSRTAYPNLMHRRIIKNGTPTMKFILYRKKQCDCERWVWCYRCACSQRIVARIRNRQKAQYKPSGPATLICGIQDRL